MTSKERRRWLRRTLRDHRMGRGNYHAYKVLDLGAHGAVYSLAICPRCK